jgi:hypothetical protein
MAIGGIPKKRHHVILGVSGGPRGQPNGRNRTPIYPIVETLAPAHDRQSGGAASIAPPQLMKIA